MRKAANESSQLLVHVLSLLGARATATEQLTADRTAAAIALLAAWSHDEGDVRAVRTHLDGLSRIVANRGGLAAIRKGNPMVANLIFWCGLIVADEPTLLPFKFEGLTDELFPTIAYRQSLDWLDIGDELRQISSTLDESTARVLLETQRLSQQYTSRYGDGSIEESMDTLTRSCIIIQHLLALDQFSVDRYPTALLISSCRIGFCLHVLTPASAYFPQPTLVLQSLIASLKSKLAPLVRTRGKHDMTLMWLLAVGGITSHSMTEHGWFVRYLELLSADLGIQQWPSLRNELLKMISHNDFCDDSYKKLWAEVLQKRESLT